MTVIDATKDSPLNVDMNQVERGVDALLQYLAKKPRKDEFINESQAIDLQLGFKKVPRLKEKKIKIILPHHTLSPQTSVCLFVKDLDKKDRDVEETVYHYKELLEKHGVTYVDEVIPLKALKMEYQPYEAKRNLCTLHDVFLADASIMRLLPTFLGKNFYKRRKLPIQVNIRAGSLKKEIEKALGKTVCVISGRGSCCQARVAHSKQTKPEILANVQACISTLVASIEGGANNIKSLHIKSEDSPSLPIYMDLSSGDDVELAPKKRKREFIEPEDVTPVIHGKVRVTARGAITIVNKANATEEEKSFLKKQKKRKNRKNKLKGSGKENEMKENAPAKDTVEISGKKGKKRRVSEIIDDIETDHGTPSAAAVTETSVTSSPTSVSGKKGKKRRASESLMEEEDVSQTPSSKRSRGKNSPKTPQGDIGKETKTPKSDKKTHAPATPIASVSKTPKSQKKANDKSASPLTQVASDVKIKTPKSQKKSTKAQTPTPVTPVASLVKEQKTPKSLKKANKSASPLTQVASDVKIKTPKSQKKSTKAQTPNPVTPVASPVKEQKTPKSHRKGNVESSSPLTQVASDLKKKTPKSQKKSTKAQTPTPVTPVAPLVKEQKTPKSQKKTKAH